MRDIEFERWFRLSFPRASKNERTVARVAWRAGCDYVRTKQEARCAYCGNMNVADS